MGQQDNICLLGLYIDTKNYILTSNSTQKQYKEKHSISTLKFQRFQTPSVINRYMSSDG